MQDRTRGILSSRLPTIGYRQREETAAEMSLHVPSAASAPNLFVVPPPIPSAFFKCPLENQLAVQGSTRIKQ